MYTVEVALKANPLTLSVQRKEKEGAEALYQEILAKISNSHNPTLLELTCEKQEDKKIAVFVSEISAVLVTEKSGAMTNSGAGFVRN
jgi:hypothetical protein